MITASLKISKRYTAFHLCILFFFLVLVIRPLQGQSLEVSNGQPYTPESLITNFLLDDGIEIVSIVYEGMPEAVGYFKNGASNIGLNRGIVMTTGLVVSNEEEDGVDAPGFVTASWDNGSDYKDKDLEDLVGYFDVENVTRYIIKLIPISNTLRFRYVFGSEEYPEYVCSEYNDVFGFFISGPGIFGPYQNGAENIALIPESDRPVTINSVNPGMPGDETSVRVKFCEEDQGSLNYAHLYRDNNDSTSFPVYDGLTAVFVAEKEVIPGETYTIKLVIADVGDHRLDSGVFLEAKSFESPALEAAASNLSIEGAIGEGCNPGMLTFTLPQALEEDYKIDYLLQGTAEMGSDFEAIPTDLIIPAGETQLSVPIAAMEDHIDEERESLVFDFAISPTTRRTYTIFIDDAKLLPPSQLEKERAVCEDSELLLLEGTSPVTVPTPVTFSSTESISTPGLPTEAGAAESTIQVSGIVPEKLLPDLIQSVCIDSFEHDRIADLDFYLIGPDGQYLELTSDNDGGGSTGDWPAYYSHLCFMPGASQPIELYQPDTSASTVAFAGNFLPEGEWSDFWGPDRSSNGTYTLLFIDDQEGSGGTLYEWSITFATDYGITYEWSPGVGLSCLECPNPTVQPEETTAYALTIRDTYGCVFQDTTTVFVPDTELAVDLESNQDGIIDISISGGIPPYSFLWSDGSTREDLIVTQVGIYSVTVTDSKGCVTGLDEIMADQVNAINHLTPGSGIVVFPNPSRGSFIISLVKDLPSVSGQLSLFNAEGKCFYLQPVMLSPARALSIDLPSVPQGICYLQLATAEGVINEKIIFQ